VIIAALGGFLLVRTLGSGPLLWCKHDFLRLALGTGLGIGVCSSCFFLGLFSGISGLLLEVTLFLAVAIYLVLHSKLAICCFCESSTRPASEYGLTAALAGVFALMLIMDAAAFASTIRHMPQGGWDATAIWNLRARFLYRAAEGGWRDGFVEVLAWSHPDYPLMLPGFIARTWRLLGRESQTVAIALACFFSFGTVGLITASLSILRGVRQGLLAGLVILATPVLFTQAAWQYADAPLSFYILAAFATMAIADRFNSSGYAVLAGGLAALGGWTKNEGVLCLAALLLARIIIARSLLLLSFLLGATPVLAVILLFKARVATSSDIFGPSGRAGMVARLLDPSRYMLILHEAIKHVWEFGPLIISPFLILAAYLAIVGIQQDDRDRAMRSTVTLTLLFIAVGYFATYVVHPNPLAWELDRSADRLLLQIWPGIVFSVFLAARSPRPAREESRQSSAPAAVTADEPTAGTQIQLI
jgi:hypothetical protein